jgi:hypothetical protein
MIRTPTSKETRTLRVEIGDRPLTIASDNTALSEVLWINPEDFLPSAISHFVSQL